MFVAQAFPRALAELTIFDRIGERAFDFCIKGYFPPKFSLVFLLSYLGV